MKIGLNKWIETVVAMFEHKSSLQSRSKTANTVSSYRWMNNIGRQPLFLGVISTNSYRQRLPRQLTYSIHFELAAVHQHWRSIRDDKTRKTNNSFEKHRRQIKRSNRLKRVSIVHQLYEARLIAILYLVFQDGSPIAKSITIIIILFSLGNHYSCVLNCLITCSTDVQLLQCQDVFFFSSLIFVSFFSILSVSLAS